jgi:hypothetical protein
MPAPAPAEREDDPKPQSMEATGYADARDARRRRWIGGRRGCQAWNAVAHRPPPADTDKFPIGRDEQESRDLHGTTASLSPYRNAAISARPREETFYQTVPMPP